MARLIDADALIADLDEGLWGKEWDKALAEAIIKDAPTIDAVSVVHGEWIDEHEDGHGSWVGTCSQCHNTERVANFCPNCGAKMDGEREGE